MTENVTEAATPAFSPLQTLLRFGVFRRLWLGSLISAVGDTLTWMALIWFVLDQGGSGGAVSGLMLSFALPALLTGSAIGHLLDQYQPRTIMVADNVVRGVLIALIPLLHYSGHLNLWIIYLIAALSGALAPATQAGVRSVVPATVPKEALAEANAALAWTTQLPTILAPALAGVIIAHWGALNGILLDAVSFLFMAGMLAGTPNVPRGTAVGADGLPSADSSAARGGPLILLRYPAVTVMTGIAFVFFFAYGPTETALPLFTRNTLKTDAQGYGLLWTAVGVGSLLGGLFAPRLSPAATTRPDAGVDRRFMGRRAVRNRVFPYSGDSGGLFFCGRHRLGAVYGPGEHAAAENRSAGGLRSRFRRSDSAFESGDAARNGARRRPASYPVPPQRDLVLRPLLHRRRTRRPVRPRPPPPRAGKPANYVIRNFHGTLCS